MLKVLKNLKESFWSVLVIVIFLCVQSQTDLALPGYISKIVNVGIQSGGIESPIPEVLSKEDFQLIEKFSPDNSNEIKSQYKKTDEDLTKFEEKKAKKLLGDNFKESEKYILKENISSEEKENLNKIIISPVLELGTIKNKETSNKIKEELINNMAGKMPEMQLEKIKEETLENILLNMEKENSDKLIQKYNEEISKLPESLKEQSAIGSIKTIYQDLGINTDNIQNEYIIYTGIKMLGVALLTMISAIIVMFLSAKVAAKLAKTLREKVFNKVLTFSKKELREYSTASLITRTTNDVQQIQQLLAVLFRVLVYAPIIAIGGFTKVLTATNNSLAWIIGVVILAVLFIVATLFIITMPKFSKLQKLIDKINAVSREILTGLPVIRAFSKEEKEEKRFDEANKNLMKVNKFVNRGMSLMMPLLMLVMNASTILVIWFGGKSIDGGMLQVGDMMAFMQYMMQIVMSFLMISMVSIMLPRANISAKRINEILETEPSIKDKEKQLKFDETKKGLVEFKNVCFRYPDADTEILEDITFTAKPGTTTAIIGSTGSGKSTIINLIPRFYDVTNGSILVDGVNIKDVKQQDLREKIGLVPQKGVLFSGTIESNIKYASETISDETMIKAANIAQATEFIERKEEKYQDKISQGGNNVSGGQKQRLSIARAIAKDPEIYIFDDSFSALDFKTDSKLREELNKVAKDKTIIIVAQRINTILNADQIIVLEEGKVVGIGTHKELLKENEVYRQIALSQLSEKELGGE